MAGRLLRRMAARIEASSCVMVSVRASHGHASLSIKKQVARDGSVAGTECRAAPLVVSIALRSATKEARMCGAFRGDVVSGL